MVTQMKAIAILTWQECLQWTKTGIFRNNKRVVNIDKLIKQIDFNNLMERAPYVTLDEDQAFVIACLKKDWRKYRDNDCILVDSDIDLISLDAVEQFSAMSQHGFMVLKGEAERLMVGLKGPECEALWQSWVKSQSEAQSVRRAKSFVAMLGLPPADDPPFDSDVLPYLIDGGCPAPDAGKLESATKSRAYGWSFAIQIFGRLLDNEQKMLEILDELRLRDIVNILSKNPKIDEPLSNDENIVTTIKQLNKTLRSESKTKSDIMHIAIITHYRHVVKCNTTLDLDSLVLDLATLGSGENPKSASNIACVIGRSLGDDFVSTLSVASRPADFPAMSVQKRRTLPNINVVAVTEKLRERRILEHASHYFQRKIESYKARPSEMSSVGVEEIVVQSQRQSVPKSDIGVVTTGCDGSAEGDSVSAPYRAIGSDPVGTTPSSDVEGVQMALLTGPEPLSKAGAPPRLPGARSRSPNKRR